MDEDDAQLEAFALQDLKQRLFDFVGPSTNHGPFVLPHGNLRPQNLIVPENSSISALIDWERSCAIPQRFYVPPKWLGGCDIPNLCDNCF